MKLFYLCAFVFFTGCMNDSREVHSKEITKEEEMKRKKGEKVEPLTLSVNGKKISVQKALFWFNDIAGTKSAQLNFYDADTDCSDRLKPESIIFRAGLLGSNDIKAESEYRLLNVFFSTEGVESPNGHGKAFVKKVVNKNIDFKIEYTATECSAGDCVNGSCSNGGVCRKDWGVCIRKCKFTVKGVIRATWCKDYV